MAAHPQPNLTLAEYFALDDAAELPVEYADGMALAMSGGTLNHSVLIMAMGRRLSNALDGKPCVVSGNTLRLQIPGGTEYLYPDVMVICGGAQMAEGANNTVTNPTVIVEVLSGSTERWDRIGKFAKYRKVPSLREYVLVAQDEMLIEWYTRRDNGEWVYQVATGPDEVCHLSSIDISLPLADIYSKIDLA
jgi:Uma2 family endonuclease